MDIHHERLSDTDRYIETHKGLGLDAYAPTYRSYIAYIERFHRLGSASRVLEIGTGPGWFPIMCKANGIPCEGLEISPQLIEFAHNLGRQVGVEPDIRLGNLEDTDLGENTYDAIVASNVFEHVEHWQRGLATLHRALKPGGVLYFESTNKFSFTSGEYNFPLYGWLPDKVRYRMRIARQGPDIMKLGIDFHQFTHGILRREFKKVGFATILDRIEMSQESLRSSQFRSFVVKAGQAFPPFKLAALTFADATRFLCVK